MSLRYKHGMNWIRQEKRLAIYMRDNFSCLYCGIGIEEAQVILTLDHVQHYGTNNANNLVTACFDCNRAKSCWSLRKFLKQCPEPEKVRERIERALARDIKKLLPEAKEVLRRRKEGEPF